MLSQPWALPASSPTDELIGLAVRGPLPGVQGMLALCRYNLPARLASSLLSKLDAAGIALGPPHSPLRGLAGCPLLQEGLSDPSLQLQIILTIFIPQKRSSLGERGELGSSSFVSVAPGPCEGHAHSSGPCWTGWGWGEAQNRPKLLGLLFLRTPKSFTERVRPLEREAGDAMDQSGQTTTATLTTSPFRPRLDSVQDLEF